MDISAYTDTDPNKFVLAQPLKKSQEKKLIRQNLAPSLKKRAGTDKKAGKKKIKSEIKEIVSEVKKSASSLKGSMKGKYIDRAEEDISKTAEKMTKIVE